MTMKPTKGGYYQLNCLVRDGNIIRKVKMMASLLGKTQGECVLEALTDWLTRANIEHEQSEDAIRKCLQRGIPLGLKRFVTDEVPTVAAKEPSNVPVREKELVTC